MRIDTTAIDDRLEAFVVALARRRSPVLRVVPARWLRPMVKPAVMRARRSLVRAVLAAVLLAAAVGAVAIIAR